MSGGFEGTSRYPAFPFNRRWLPVPAILALAVLAGLAAGDRSLVWLILLGSVAGVALIVAGMRWPFAGLLVLVGSSSMLVVVMVSGLRSANAFDVLLLPVFVASACGIARHEAIAHARREHGGGHDELHSAERRLTRSVLWFYGFAMLSLIRLAMVAGTPAALDSGLVLARALQGILLYPLCSWWLRSRQRVQYAWNALFVGGVALVVVNIIGVSLWHVHRAGMTLMVNNPDPITDPNEAGTAALVVGVVLLVRNTMRRDWKNWALAVPLVALLGLTQSRSGILAWLTFGLFTLRWVRPSRVFAGIVTIALLVPLMPRTFSGRMVNTLAVKKGSFEAFSFYQRVYAWKTAWNCFEANPLGVGYLGFRFVSHRFNALSIAFGTVENYFLEILVSMGIVGVVLLTIVIVRLFQLGSEVARRAPRGSLGFHMARFHAPLILGLVVANLTGDNFVGLVGVAQVAIWTAVLVRAGHAAIAETVAA